jgi:hypothetical protein
MLAVSNLWIIVFLFRINAGGHSLNKNMSSSNFVGLDQGALFYAGKHPIVQLCRAWQALLNEVLGCGWRRTFNERPLRPHVYICIFIIWKPITRPYIKYVSSCVEYYYFVASWIVMLVVAGTSHIYPFLAPFRQYITFCTACVHGIWAV